jgi:site-specific recombinase XerD
MNPADWIDTAGRPAGRLPDTVAAALLYLETALGHVIYRRWTLQDLRHGHPSLADARDRCPAVYAVLVTQRHDVAIEYWARGRVATVPAGIAPAPEAVLAAVLRSRRTRFARATAVGALSAVGAVGAVPVGRAPLPPTAAATGTPAAHTAAHTAAHPAAAGTAPSAGAAPDALSELDLERAAALRAWLSRHGRLAQPEAPSNLLGARDDAQAIRVFLRERASGSRHTARAYLSELQRLVAWCDADGRGPLSDLSRDDLLRYRDALARPGGADRSRLAEASQRRALAVVASLFGYWRRHGYLLANPAADLTAGAGARAGYQPQRILPSALLDVCDAWLERSAPDVNTGAGPSPDPGADSLLARRRAIWALYRYGGVRLAELIWDEAGQLPRLEVGADGDWTLHVLGKGRKLRAVQLPQRCVAVLRVYRQARGLPGVPPPGERAPLIHGAQRGSLERAGLYREVKRVLHTIADQLDSLGDGEGRGEGGPGALGAGLPGGLPERAHAANLLRRASPHWLRHAYAKTLVVDKQVPLPVAQRLLGHASITTTAAYAQTDGRAIHRIVKDAFD